MALAKLIYVSFLGNLHRKRCFFFRFPGWTLFIRFPGWAVALVPFAHQALGPCVFLPALSDTALADLALVDTVLP